MVFYSSVILESYILNLAIIVVRYAKLYTLVNWYRYLKMRVLGQYYTYNVKYFYIFKRAIIDCINMQNLIKIGQFIVEIIYPIDLFPFCLKCFNYKILVIINDVIFKL